MNPGPPPTAAALLILALAGGLSFPAGYFLPGRPFSRTLLPILLVLPVLVSLPSLLGAESWLSTEGPVEVLTEGLLLGFSFRALRSRDPLAALAGFLVLAEELDWGQVLFDFPTPAWVRALPSRSDRLNFHNLGWTDAFWKPIPVLLILARSRWPKGAAILRFHPHTYRRFLALLPGLLLVRALTDPRATNEVGEFSLVVWVLLSWSPPEPSPVRPSSPPAG